MNSEAAEIRKKAKKQGYGYQLTDWQTKENFGFIDSCIERLKRDETRTYKVFHLTICGELHKALFVNDVSIKSESTRKSEIKGCMPRNIREGRVDHTR